jgi:hypothetical protein
MSISLAAVVVAAPAAEQEHDEDDDEDERHGVLPKCTGPNTPMKYTIERMSPMITTARKTLGGDT